MKVQVRNCCSDFDSYRAARVKSLFNVERGCDFDLDAEVPDLSEDWSIGVVVGPSGSGKTSVGRLIDPSGGGLWNDRVSWPAAAPIIDAILPDGDIDAATGALTAVGLGSVPAWLRPYSALSNGERFRADLARLVCEAPPLAVVDEFTSVVDRQIARVGAAAFAKAWRRTRGKAVLLTCHYDVLDWLEPDWVLDTNSGTLARGRVRRRPDLTLDIRQTRGDVWPLFAPHHYLKLPRMIACKHYVGSIDGEPVAHVAFSTKNVGKGNIEARACRLVVMPEWQGIGVGMRFLGALCDLYLRGEGHYPLPMTTIFHTSHPGLAAALRRSKGWRQVSCSLFGSDKRSSETSIVKSRVERGLGVITAGWGGHFRAVQGFRYYGPERLAAC